MWLLKLVQMLHLLTILETCRNVFIVLGDITVSIVRHGIFFPQALRDELEEKKVSFIDRY